MDIAVGDKVLMQYSTLGDRLLSVVTEVREGEFIIVYSPISPIIAERLRENNTAIIRYIVEGMLRGYKTHVLDPVTAEDELIRVAYPRLRTDVEERKEPRCPCCFPAMLHVGGELYEAHIADMSSSALRIRFHDSSTALYGNLDGTGVLLEFFIFEPSNTYKVKCRVLRSFMREQEKFAVLEIQDGEEIKAKIARFVQSQCQGGFLNRL